MRPNVRTAVLTALTFASGPVHSQSVLSRLSENDDVCETVEELNELSEVEFAIERKQFIKETVAAQKAEESGMNEDSPFGNGDAEAMAALMAPALVEEIRMEFIAKVATECDFDEPEILAAADRITSMTQGMFFQMFGVEPAEDPDYTNGPVG